MKTKVDGAILAEKPKTRLILAGISILFLLPVVIGVSGITSGVLQGILVIYSAMFGVVLGMLTAALAIMPKAFR